MRAMLCWISECSEYPECQRFGDFRCCAYRAPIFRLLGESVTVALIVFVALYVMASIAIGLYAARRVSTSADYVIAGRHLPMHMTVATVFATWFGSETVLGIPATFLKEGAGGIVADPFGAALCLVLVGLFFARPLYRMQLLTIGDFFRRKYGPVVEFVVSLCICASYLGWVSAQIIALGLVFNILSAGAISVQIGMCAGLAIVLLYTIAGGMWSVALTDFFQMTIIGIGLIIVVFVVAGLVGGPGVVIAHAAANGKFNILPSLSTGAIFAFLGALLTMGFGSIPQQDVFQRVMSAKNETVAARGTIIGGCLYFCFAMIPIFLAYSANLIDAKATGELMAKDSQRILPFLILNHTHLIVQIIFFGALLSAIMSTASATLLAPAVLFAENIIRPRRPELADRTLLLIIRVCVLVFAAIVLTLALNSSMSIFKMVENAYKVTLTGAFVPLAAGVFWRCANTQGALLSSGVGIATWLMFEVLALYGFAPMPPQLAGFFAACAGMMIGGYAYPAASDSAASSETGTGSEGRVEAPHP